MTKDPTFSDLAVDTETDAVCALLNGGYLRLYSGAKPVSANDALTTQVLIAELQWGNPAFQPSAGGQAAAYPLFPVNALATDQVAWFRALTADGTSAVFDGTVGSTGPDFDMTIDNVNLQAGAQVTLNSFTYTNPERI